MQRIVRRALSAILEKVGFKLTLPRTVALAAFSIAATLLASFLLPEETIVNTLFPTLESMWNNVP
jgi:hypothetical protein